MDKVIPLVTGNHKFSSNLQSRKTSPNRPTVTYPASLTAPKAAAARLQQRPMPQRREVFGYGFQPGQQQRALPIRLLFWFRVELGGNVDGIRLLGDTIPFAHSLFYFFELGV